MRQQLLKKILQKKRKKTTCKLEKMELILRCPQCRQTMKYIPRGQAIGKVKKCVYCGKSFTINRERIDA